LDRRGRKQLLTDPAFARGLFALTRISLNFTLICEQAGVTLIEFRILDVIATEPVRAGLLAERLRVRAPRITSLIESFHQRGLATRETVEHDRRGVQLRITSEGRAVLDTVRDDLLRFLLRLGDAASVRDAMQHLEGLSNVMDEEFLRLSDEMPLRGRRRMLFPS
jgi:DNA-binding MarR family transcriptional regulator